MNPRIASSLVALGLMSLITGACTKHEVQQTGTAPPPTAVKGTTSSAAPGGAVNPASEDVISLPASQGTVSFPHKKHQELLKDCSKCHEKGPGKIEGFGKEWAHAKCKGCHKDMNQGPTSCPGCHKK